MKQLSGQQPFAVVDQDTPQIIISLTDLELIKAINQMQDKEELILKINDADMGIEWNSWSYTNEAVTFYIKNFNALDISNEIFSEENIAKRISISLELYHIDTFVGDIILLNREELIDDSFYNFDGFNYNNLDNYLIQNEPFHLNGLFDSIPGHQTKSAEVFYKRKDNQTIYSTSVNLNTSSIYLSDIDNSNIIEYKPCLEYNVLLATDPYLTSYESSPTEINVFLKEKDYKTIYQFTEGKYSELTLQNLKNIFLYYLNRDNYPGNFPIGQNSILTAEIDEYIISSKLFNVYYQVIYYLNGKQKTIQTFFIKNDLSAIFDYVDSYDYIDIFRYVQPIKQINPQDQFLITEFGIRLFNTPCVIDYNFKIPTLVPYVSEDENYQFKIKIEEILNVDKIKKIEGFFRPQFFNMVDVNVEKSLTEENSYIITTPSNLDFDENGLYEKKGCLVLQHAIDEDYSQLEEDINNNITISSINKEECLYTIHFYSEPKILNPKYIYPNTPFYVDVTGEWDVESLVINNITYNSDSYNSFLLDDLTPGEYECVFKCVYNNQYFDTVKNLIIVDIDSLNIQLIQPSGVIQLSSMDETIDGFKINLLFNVQQPIDFVNQLAVEYNDDEANGILFDLVLTDNNLFKVKTMRHCSIGYNKYQIDITDKYSSNIIKSFIIPVVLSVPTFSPILEERIPTYFIENNSFEKIEIPFKYTNNLEGLFFEAKIFNMNNQLIEVINSSDIKKGHQIIKKNNNLYLQIYTNKLEIGSFYKISMRLFGYGDSTPWSNIGIFKISIQPDIFRLPWGYGNISDTIQCIMTNTLDEPIEALEYQYKVSTLDNFCFYTKKEIININQVKKTDNNIYTFLLKPFLLLSKNNNINIFDDINQIANRNEQVYVKLELNFITKNGQFIKNFYEADEQFSFTVNNQRSIAQVITTIPGINHIEFNDLSLSDGSPGYIFNNNINIKYTDDYLDVYLDYTPTYKNNYDFFVIDTNKTPYEIFYQSYKQQINDFNNVYLIDINKSKQLNITLNNKITSFKRNLLETKTNTLGGVYPRFYKNPNTQYREFPISGTISYQSLLIFENNFNSLDAYDIDIKDYIRGEKEPTSFTNLTNLENQNIYSERKFREDVLDFLQNTDKFLYKSPTEGNIVVKLMNISLTPNQQLGRMIYDFTCTAYEVQDLQSYLDENN